MKKLLKILVIALGAAALLSGCTNRYTEGVEIPNNFPKEIEIYDDAVVFETVEDDDKIVIYCGVQDDADAVGEFYMEEITNNLQIIINEWDEGRDEYVFEGIGSCYDFSIEAAEAKDKEARYYKTVVGITIEYIEDRMELMDNMQGNWLFAGLEGEMLDEVKRHCMYYLIDENSYGFYENGKSELDETYVFFLEDNQIVTQSAEGVTDPYDIAFEQVDGTDAMTMSSSEQPAQHFMNVSDDALKQYKNINKTWNSLKGFWHRIGAKGVLGDEYKGFAYDFSDYQFDVYVDLDITSTGVMYDVIDADTIEHQMNGEIKSASIVFETIEDTDVMTLDYGDTVMHFEKTTEDEYRLETAAFLNADNLEQMQGLWYMIGIDGEITDVQKDMGFAYEFRGNRFDTYNGFVMTNYDTEFYFIDIDRFEYFTQSGYRATAHIGFETIDDIDVMTYTVDTTPYHFIKVSYDEFLGYDRPLGEDTLRNLQGFWQLAGDSGSLSDESREQGFAYEFSENTFSTYNEFVLRTQNTEFSFVTDNEISYLLSNGLTTTADIKFEKIDGIDVMTYTINGAEYHFIKTTFDEYIKGAELSKLAIGFWIMVGQGGSLSEEVRAEGNAIEFTEDMMTTYVNYEISIQTDDYTIENNKIIYDFGTGILTAKIEFKTIDGVEVLSATILLQEYYFIRSTYDEFMASK